MEVDRERLFRRLTGRRTCRSCGRVFNIYTAPPSEPPPCGGQCISPDLFHRPDDSEATIGKRLEVYESQTRPLIDYYDARGLLVRVDAEGGSGDRKGAAHRRRHHTAAPNNMTLTGSTTSTSRKVTCICRCVRRISGRL